MYRIRSARPPFLSSASKVCHYATDKPAKPRHIITELKGISIPSLSELQEQARLRKEKEKKPLDITYLKDAPDTSLAGRLARATAEQAKPEPKGVTRTKDDLKRMAEQRRAARIARETAEANKALGQFKPNPVLERVAANAAAMGSYPTARAPAPRASQRKDTPQKSRPAARPEPSPTEKILQGVVENRDPIKSKADKEPKEPLVVQLEEPVQIDDVDIDPSIEVDTSASRKDRQSAYEQKQKMRQRDHGSRAGFVDKRDRKTGQVNKSAPSQLKGVERRREERLLRESRDFDEPRAPKKRISRAAKADKVESRKVATPQEIMEAVATFEETEEEDRITPAFTGPEPVSTTLAEFFTKSPALRSYPPGKAPPLVADYSYYVPPSTDALFSKPIENLSAVEIATAALSHRADIGLRQRKEALASIAAATKSRPPNVEARA